MTREDLRHVDERVVWNRSDHVLDVLLKGLWFTIYWLLYCLKENVRVSIVKQTHLEQLLRERVLFIGTQFSILYTVMYSPA